MNNPLEFNILIAQGNLSDAEPLKSIIQLEMSPSLEGIELQVHIVDTLARARELRDIANVTILDLQLKDAGPEEVIAAIPKFHRPVFIYTEEVDLQTKEKCEALKAEVLIKGKTTIKCFGVTLLKYLSKDVRMTMQETTHAENLYAAATP